MKTLNKIWSTLHIIVSFYYFLSLYYDVQMIVKAWAQEVENKGQRKFISVQIVPCG
jgi:hypothetical protein|tara:strand:- start:702 stop:869 length:168 start_codon:yes stop_codon:yes gene_type:complete